MGEFKVCSFNWYFRVFHISSLLLLTIGIFISSSTISRSENCETSEYNILCVISSQYNGNSEQELSDFVEKRLSILGKELPENPLGTISGSVKLSKEEKLIFTEKISLISVSRNISTNGFSNIKTLNSLDEAGFLYLKSNQNFSAAKLFLINALKLSANIQGLDHPQTLSLSFFLGNTLEAQGNYESAEVFYIHAANGRKKHFGEKHPKYLTSEKALSDLRAKYLYRSKQ